MKQIPDHAECVFNGILFDVYQWDQERFDGNIVRFESLVRKSASEILMIRDGMIAIIHQEQPNRAPYISVPGGHLESGESSLEGARRELLEETGYTGNFTLLREYFGSSKVRFHESIFTLHDPVQAAEPRLDGGERIRLEWISFDDFLQLTRRSEFSVSYGLRFEMYECLVDTKKRQVFSKELGV